MNKRHIKLIMELIFIFILPLVFICFTSEIQVEREFTYDNQGNYETSNDTKSLSFDNSIIKYTKNQEIIVDTLVINNNWSLIQSNTIIYLDTTNYYDNIDNIYFYVIYQDNNAEQVFGIGYRIYSNSYELVLYNMDSSTIVDTIGTYFETKDNYIGFTTNNNFNYISFDSILENKGYYLVQQTTDTIVVNTIWGNIKQLLINNLDLNDNVLLNIVLCYTILWFIMWILWHLFYGFLELLIHVIPRKWESDY